MYEVGVAARFDAAHRLESLDDPSSGGDRHEHGYRVEVAVRGEELSEDGMLLDIDRLSAAVSACLAELSSADLDALPSFAGRPTTVETVAEHVWRHVRGELEGPPGLAGLRVTVFESDEAWASLDRGLYA
jgi:6-pyruvoyltetrahydropterin/6-carboxytetrahydropterin synthase